MSLISGSDDFPAMAAWVRQQIAEDRAWANAANQAYRHGAGDRTVPKTGVHWEWVTGDRWTAVTPDPVAEEFLDGGAEAWLATREEWFSPLGDNVDPTDRRHYMRHTYFSADEVDSSAAGHIVRHDPARVLADCEADESILTWAQRLNPGDDLGGLLALDARFVVCTLTWKYHERPGWEPHWKPSTFQRQPGLRDG